MLLGVPNGRSIRGRQIRAIVQMTRKLLLQMQSEVGNPRIIEFKKAEVKEAKI